MAMIALFRAKLGLDMTEPSQNFAPVWCGCPEIGIEVA
jgi:hypothetical protein